jgi:hypothetical protein
MIGYQSICFFHPILTISSRRAEAREVARRAIDSGALWADEWQRCPIFVKGT